MEGHQVPLKICKYALSHTIKFHGIVLHVESELSPVVVVVVVVLLATLQNYIT